VRVRIDRFKVSWKWKNQVNQHQQNQLLPLSHSSIKTSFFFFYHQIINLNECLCFYWSSHFYLNVDVDGNNNIRRFKLSFSCLLLLLLVEVLFLFDLGVRKLEWLFNSFLFLSLYLFIYFARSIELISYIKFWFELFPQFFIHEFYFFHRKI